MLLSEIQQVRIICLPVSRWEGLGRNGMGGGGGGGLGQVLCLGGGEI